jgi:hypothetical protein
MSSLKHTAIGYATRGVSVHPLPPGEKKSRTLWAERQRVAMTEREVEEHWTQHPEDNIAIITGALSKLVVVDVDPSHGGVSTPFEGTTPLVVQTRSGGWHFYYQHPGHHVKSVAGPNPSLPGVDVRGDGGYVVAPPSRVDPGLYSWRDCDLVDLPPDSLPSFEVVEKLIFPVREVIQKVDNPPAPEGFVAHGVADSTGWVTKALTNGAPMGSQRQVLCQLAGYLAGKAVPSDVAYGILFSWVCRQRQNAKDPWQPRHVQDLVESIYEREAKKVASDPLDGAESTIVGARPAAGDSAPLMEAVQVDDFVDRYGKEATPWLVEDWVPEGTVGMVQSPPGSYKTWLLLDMAASVASGSPFLQRYPVYRPGPVVYIQQEDPRHLLSERVSLIRYAKEAVALGITDPASFWVGERSPLYLVTDAGFSFGNPVSRDRLVTLLKELHPHLVMLDPLYTACPAGQFFIEMPDHIKWLRRLRDRYGCAFLLAHHTKKQNAEQGDLGREQMFGSNLMNAAIESGWIVRPAGDRAVTIKRHFKVAAPIERKKFEFDIDHEKFPPFTCTESELDDKAVVQEEKPQLDDLRQLILASLRTEGAKTAPALAKALGQPSRKMQRHVQKLVDMGLVVRDADKKLSITKVDPKEVA